MKQYIVMAVVILCPFVRADDTHGSMYIENALVHSILPAHPQHKTPVIMIPGMNLSSWIFITTPDGRPGWLHEFAKDGYNTYVINDPDYDFRTGGFDAKPFTVPEEGAPPADPSSRQGWGRDVWPRWGFGASRGNPYPDTRFPTKHFAAFEDAFPYVSRTRRSYPVAIVALLEKTGPAVLMAHSAGAGAAVEAALNRPDLVVGFILIEPAGGPDQDDFPTLAGKSMLGIYGDYIASRRQGRRKLGTETVAKLFSQNGGFGEVISLPDDLDIHGNTHLMMQDDNSKFIAEQIMQWIETNTDWAKWPEPETSAAP